MSIFPDKIAYIGDPAGYAGELEDIIYGLRLDIAELKEEIEAMRERVREYERMERGWGGFAE